MDTHEAVVIDGKLVKKGETIDGVLYRGRCLLCNPFCNANHTQTSVFEQRSQIRAVDGEPHDDGIENSSIKNVANENDQEPSSQARPEAMPKSCRESSGSRVLSLAVAESSNYLEKDSSSCKKRDSQTEAVSHPTDPNIVTPMSRPQVVSPENVIKTKSEINSKKRANDGDALGSKKRTKAQTSMDSFVKDLLTRAKSKAQNHKLQDKSLETLRIQVEKATNDKEKRQWIHSINNCGGLGVVLDAMNYHRTKSSVQYEGCKMVAFLAWAGVDSETLEQEGIEAVLSVLKSGPCARVAAAGLEALVNLSTTPRIRDKIFAEGGLDVATGIMKKIPQNAKLQAEACTFILNLASCGNKKNAVLISRTCAIPLIIAAMKNHEKDDVIIETSCEALQNLSVTNMARTEIAKAGGINVILELVETEVEETQGDILDLLRNLTSDHVSVQSQVVCAGGVEKILALMEEFPSNDLLLEKACEVLTNLTSCEDGCGQLLEQEGIMQIVEAMKRNEGSAGLQEEACILLGSMKRTQFWKEKIKQKGVLEALKKAAELFPEQCSGTVGDIEAAITL